MKSRKIFLLTKGGDIIGAFTKLTSLVSYIGKDSQMSTIRRDLSKSDSIEYGPTGIKKIILYITERKKRK